MQEFCNSLRSVLLALFKAESDELPGILQWVRKSLQNVALPLPEIRKVELALEEAIVNIIRHAYPNSSGQLEIICQHVPQKKLVFIIKDKGTPFNPLTRNNQPILNETVEEVEEGGLGILLMRKCVDEVRYERLHSYNVLTLIKKLD